MFIDEVLPSFSTLGERKIGYHSMFRTRKHGLLSLVFIYRNSSAILLVGGHWRVQCFVLWYKFSSPVATDNTSPMIPDELRYMKTRLKGFYRFLLGWGSGSDSRSKSARNMERLPKNHHSDLGGIRTRDLWITSSTRLGHQPLSRMKLESKFRFLLTGTIFLISFYVEWIYFHCKTPMLYFGKHASLEKIAFYLCSSIDENIKILEIRKFGNNVR